MLNICSKFPNSTKQSRSDFVARAIGSPFRFALLWPSRVSMNLYLLYRSCPRNTKPSNEGWESYRYQQALQRLKVPTITGHQSSKMQTRCECIKRCLQIIKSEYDDLETVESLVVVQTIFAQETVYTFLPISSQSDSRKAEPYQVQNFNCARIWAGFYDKFCSGDPARSCWSSNFSHTFPQSNGGEGRRSGGRLCANEN